MTIEGAGEPGAALTRQGDTLPLPAEGLLHGAVLRPAQLRWDGQRHRGAELQTLDGPDAQALPGVAAIVRQQHFVGVVAVSAVLARQALDSLRPLWHLPAAAAVQPAPGAYVWHLPPRAAGAEAATVWCSAGQATAWVPGSTAQREAVRAELALVLDMPPASITVQPLHAVSDSVHTLDLLDATADAALLSLAVQRPVRVPLPGQPAPGALVLRPGGDAGQPATTLVADTPWAARPSLARLLARPAQGQPSAAGTVQGLAALGFAAGAAPLVHAAADQLDAARVFAEQSLLDEQAAQRGLDPVAHRLQQLPPGPARRLAEQTAARAQWQAAPAGDGTGAVRLRDAPDGRHHGRGFATAHVREQTPGAASSESWSSWIADVAVDPTTGHIELTRVVVGHDSQSLQPAQAAAIHTQDARLLAAGRRLLAAPASFDDWGAAAPTTTPGTADAQPLATASDGALARQGQLAADGVLTLPAAAAIANAVFDATGVRLREVPFDPAQLRLALAPARSLPAPAPWRRPLAWLAGAASAAAGLLAMAWPAKPAIAPTDGPVPALYSKAAIERGRLVAAAGDCVVCHTAPGGTPNAGGLGLQTPFGTVYSSNITPDLTTGIGRWSFAAFDRAMRAGVHRDGRQLYPAFPYTAFAKLTDADMQALYAYLMVQPPVAHQPPATQLPFPYSLRPALAGWNLLFHDDAVYRPDPAQTPEWNRGAYLVQGAGHCSACHSPRNALGAEQNGPGRYLAGGLAEGWEAPPLDRLASGPRPWTAEQLFQYLRTGFSAAHGVAAGPMAPVVHGLAQLPESDVRAMASYLLNLQGAPAAAAAPAPAPAPAAVPVFEAHVDGERIYRNACAVCHEAGSGPTLFGVKPLLASNTNLHAAAPDNLVQTILHGIQAPADGTLGYMPGFADSLDDAQVAALLGYLRARFAPAEPAWPQAAATVQRLRAQAHATR